MINMSKDFRLVKFRKNKERKLPKWLNIIVSIILILIIIVIIRILLPKFNIPYFWYKYSQEWTIEPVLTWDIISRTDLNWNEFEYSELQVWEITIMDRNLWATTNDITSTWSYWYYYQWWNNYWFIPGNINIVDDKVISAERWYYDNQFITFSKNHEDRLIKPNDDLWWAKSDKYEDKQGPCPKWWHVPTNDEREYILENTKFDKLLLPMASTIGPDGPLHYDISLDWTVSSHKYAELWSSSKVSPLNWRYLHYLLDLPKRNSDWSIVINPDKHLSWWVDFSENVTKWETIMVNRSIGLNIRCFKNK